METRQMDGSPEAGSPALRAPRERGILFSAPMVRALLAWRKTQTRRLIKPQPLAGEWIRPLDRAWLAGRMRDSENAWRHIVCPYGQPGDRLWVRETWADTRGGGFDSPIHYAADCIPGSAGDMIRIDYGVKWKPSLHMPRWASRLTLEVTRVRAERLQDITDADAQAEGAVFTDFGEDRWGNQHPGWTMDPPAADQTHCLGGPRWAFANLINKLNGRECWDSNPWVWVVEFRRIEASEAKPAEPREAEQSPSSPSDIPHPHPEGQP